MKKFFEKMATAIAVLIVFVGIVCLSVACHQLVMGESYPLDILLTIAVIMIFADRLSKDLDSRAKKCLAGQLLMFGAIFLHPMLMFIIFLMGLVLFVHTWIMWEDEHQDCLPKWYGHWFGYNLLSFSFILAAEIVLMMKGMSAIVPIICFTAGLWLMMCLRLSYKLK